MCAALLLMSCQHAPQRPWMADLDESTVYPLSAKTAEIKKHLDDMQQYRKQGKMTKANEAYKEAMESLDKLQSYYIPLANARGHVAAAFRLSERGNYFMAKEELTKARAHLAAVQALTPKNLQEQIDSIFKDTVTIENNLTIFDGKTQEKLNQIAQKINQLIV